MNAPSRVTEKVFGAAHPRSQSFRQALELLHLHMPDATRSAQPEDSELAALERRAMELANSGRVAEALPLMEQASDRA